MYVFAVLLACPFHKNLSRPPFYSQYGQDEYVNTLLKSPKHGVYLDIGCNDGIDGSNTLFFYKRSWYGKCVEADPLTFNKIATNSNRSDGVNYAVASHSKKMKFLRVLDPNNGLSGLSTALRHHSDDTWRTFRHTNFHVITATPKFILQSFYSNVKKIDFVSLDVEGAEFDVLSAWPFAAEWCVAVFVIEDNNWCNSKSTWKQLFGILRTNHYRHVGSIGMDYVFQKDC